MAKKYDIIVYDKDSRGNTTQSTEHGIMAPSIQILKSLYEQCGQKIEIIREYEDDQSKNYGKIDFDNISNVKNVTSEELNLLKQQHDGSNIKINNIPSNTNEKNNKDINSSNEPNKTISEKPNNIMEKKEPVKYFSIGGIKCKMENGKMYQKQWMRLNENESLDYRIISDKNNKIIQLKDKHIEVMKWVMVEDNENDISQENNLELLNG